MQFVLFSEDEFYAWRLASIVRNHSELFDTAAICHIFNNVDFPRPHETPRSLNDLHYWFKVVTFDSSFGVRSNSGLFPNSKWVEVL